jgi:hypothetical protein
LEAREQRRAHLKLLSEIGLWVTLEGAAGSDVFLVPKEHFPDETLETVCCFCKNKQKASSSWR